MAWLGLPPGNGDAAPIFKDIEQYRKTMQVVSKLLG